MKRSSEDGSHVVALALVVLFVAVAVYAGYKVMNLPQVAPASTATTTTTKAPAAIINTATLKQAVSALDSESTQVNTNLDSSGLNTDLNDLL